MPAYLYSSNGYTTTGTKASVNVDPAQVPFVLSVIITVGTTATYKLQFSCDPADVADASALWIDSTNVPTGTTATTVTSFVSPISRMRIVIAAISGTVTLQASQGLPV